MAEKKYRSYLRLAGVCSDLITICPSRLCCSPSSETLNPKREPMPNRRVTERAHRELHDEQQKRSEDCYEMDFPARPEVKGDQKNRN